MDQFILFGDSLIQQAFSEEGSPLGAALNNAYIRKLDIVNRGFSGYNTSQALELLPKFMPTTAQGNVRFMLIFFGANDARLPNTPGGPQQHVPIELFKENLMAITTHACIRAHEGVRTILVTPPPVDERMLEIADQEKYGQPMIRRKAQTTHDYAKVVSYLGKELNVPVLDLWSAMISRSGLNDQQSIPGAKNAPVSNGLQSLFRDGLHFTPLGYRVLCEELMRLIEATWPDQMPEKLSFTFPGWDDELAWKQRSSAASL